MKLKRGINKLDINALSENQKGCTNEFWKDISGKGKDQPKLFYNYIKSKSSQRQSTPDEGNTYVKGEGIWQILSNKMSVSFY